MIFVGDRRARPHSANTKTERERVGHPPSKGSRMIEMNEGDPDDLQAQMSKTEIEAVLENAKVRLRICRRRGLVSAVAFFLSCALVVPFLDGHSLHLYWESFGIYLLWFSLGLFIVSIYWMALLWGAWRGVRELE
jgi:hypothetical protein